MATVGKQVGNAPDIRKFTASDKLVCSATYVGYELEVENMPRSPGLSALWSEKEDRSLREKGREFVFAHPLKGADVVTAMEELYLGLSAMKPKFSHRCGTHVHIDVRDLSVPQMISFVVHALVFERAMYAFSGANRDSNIFCLPYYKASDGLKGMRDLVGRQHVNHLIERSDKYYGINFAAIGRYGSVEFRMLPGTGDLARAMMWINVLLSIRAAAVANDNTDTVLASMSARGVSQYAKDVFKGTPEFLEFVTEADMYLGMRLAQGFINDNAIGEAATQLPSKLHPRSLVSVFAAKKGLRIHDPEAQLNAPEMQETLKGALMPPGLDPEQIAMLHRQFAGHVAAAPLRGAEFNPAEQLWEQVQRVNHLEDEDGE